MAPGLTKEPAAAPAPLPDSLTEIWERVMARLGHEVGDARIGAWFDGTALVSTDGGSERLRVQCRSPFVRDRIRTDYGGRLLDLIRLESRETREVTINAEEVPCDRDGTQAPAPPDDESHTAGQPDDRQTDDSATPHDRDRTGPEDPSGRPLFPVPPSVSSAPFRAAVLPAQARETPANPGLKLRPEFRFDGFVVDSSNEFAYRAACRVADAGTCADNAYNPLYLYGGVGLGKTHLMQAIAWRIIEQLPGKKVIYMTAASFTEGFIRALQQKATSVFKEHFAAADLLMIDDIQFMAGKNATQEEFFHVFSQVTETNGQVVLSGNCSLRELGRFDMRVRSRISGGLTADIHDTSYRLRLGILRARLRERGLQAEDGVPELIARRICGNVRDLQGALGRVIARSEYLDCPITTGLAEESLRDSLGRHDNVILIEDIQRRVAESFGVTVADLRSRRRGRVPTLPRQLAMYLARHHTIHSLPEIGARFGNRSHTTVIHACRRIGEMIRKDRGMERIANRIRESLDIV